MSETPTPSLTDDDLRRMGEARQLLIPALVRSVAFSYEVRALRHWRTVLGYLGFLVAVAFLYVRFGTTLVGAPKQVDTVITLLSTACSGCLMALVVWSQYSRWEGQVETKSSLGQGYRALAAALEDALAVRAVSDEALAKFRGQSRSLDEERERATALLSRKAIREGYKHIALDKKDLNPTCASCERKISAQLIDAWSRPFGRCYYCGMVKNAPS